VLVDLAGAGRRLEADPDLQLHQLAPAFGKKLAVMFGVVLLVAGCGGGKRNTTPGNPSNDTSVCAFAKRASGGRVYVEMAVTPKSQKPTACSAFNGIFGGRSIPPVGKMGTGHVYCRFSKSGASHTIKLGVFASNRTTGLAFCRSFRPGHSFRFDR
jgi:hypothetical protein